MFGRAKQGTYGDAEHGQHDAVGQEGFEGDTHFGGLGLGAVWCGGRLDGGVFDVEVDCGVAAQVEASSKLTLQKSIPGSMRAEEYFCNIAESASGEGSPEEASTRSAPATIEPSLLTVVHQSTCNSIYLPL